MPKDEIGCEYHWRSTHLTLETQYRRETYGEVSNCAVAEPECFVGDISFFEFNKEKDVDSERDKPCSAALKLLPLTPPNIFNNTIFLSQCASFNHWTLSARRCSNSEQPPENQPQMLTLFADHMEF